jgi:hypothetical protein
MAALKSHPRTTIKLRNRTRLSIVKKCIYYGIRVLVYMFSTAPSCPKEGPESNAEGGRKELPKRLPDGSIREILSGENQTKTG